jgi:hypothetical protein
MACVDAENVKKHRRDAESDGMAIRVKVLRTN